MANIEHNLRELAKANGLKLSDIAYRMGTTVSNLLSIVKGNPTVSKPEGIAAALQVSVAELLIMRPDSSQGLVIIGGHTYQLAKPAASTVLLPSFDRYDTLRKEVKDFIKKSIKGSEPTTKMGLVQTLEFFSLVYDPEADKFYLSLCYADSKTLTRTYDKMEYTVWPDDESNDGSSWNVTEVSAAIISDLEGCVSLALKSN